MIYDDDGEIVAFPIFPLFAQNREAAYVQTYETKM